jgi:amino acid transporter
MSIANALFRRKVIDSSPSLLSKTLNGFDLFLLGTGATLGAGVYVLSGVIASNAGPSTILSFAISGFASILSGLCYAEFGARVPKAGSAYTYSYVTVGEVMAFTAGWQLLLEYIIGASSVARSWSGYVDSLSNGAISTFISEHIGSMNVPGLASRPDFLAFAVTMLLSVICAIGAKESSALNNTFTIINICVILLVIIAGSFYVDTSNFSNFAPAGVSGVFSGAATAFYGYVGFDVIATSAEEAKNPSKTIPIGIIGSLVLCALFYMGVSTILTLMVPFQSIDTTAPLAQAFAAKGAAWAKYVIAVGAICGLSTSLITCIFPMPRIVYAIAQDGLLPPWIGHVNPRFHTPLRATMFCGLFAAVMALIFDITALADMMSIGTLFSYTLVATSVLILRYQAADDDRAEADAESVVTSSNSNALSAASEDKGSSESLLASSDEALSPKRGPKGWFGVLYISPNKHVYMFRKPVSAFYAAIVSLLAYCAAVAIPCILLVVLSNVTISNNAVVYLLYAIICVFLILALIAAFFLYILPRPAPKNLSFTCPGMPGLPLVSIFINFYLLVNLSYLTWIRFVVWCVIGAAIYFGYGIRNSKVGQKVKVDDEASTLIEKH